MPVTTIQSYGLANSITLTGNVTAGNLVGTFANGNSNVNIPSANGNVTITVAGNANVILVTGTGVNVAGTLNLTGNANAGNIGATNGVFTSVAGTLTTAAQPNITSVGTLTSLTVTGNATAGNFSSVGNANITGTIFSSNITFTKFNEKVVSGGNTGAVTLTPDAAAGTMYQYTLTGNITINTLGNAVAGTSMTLILTQDATGNRLLSSTMKFSGGIKTLSTAANAIDVMSVFYDGSTYYAALAKGFA